MAHPTHWADQLDSWRADAFGALALYLDENGAKPADEVLGELVRRFVASHPAEALDVIEGMRRAYLRRRRIMWEPARIVVVPVTAAFCAH